MVGMRQFLVLILVLALLLTCAVGSVLLARGWFTLRTTTTTAPAVPSVPPVPAVPATPTLSAALPPAQPAPIGGEQPGGDTPAGGFDGTFVGTLSGDNGTSAPATLVMSRSGDAVSARLEIGQGLTLDAGSCGVQAVPAGAQSATGTIDPAAPNRLQSQGSIPVAGFAIGVALAAELAADGQTLAARADLDLPFLCGRDAAIGGTFLRE